jgi:hypothetical protein
MNLAPSVPSGRLLCPGLLVIALVAGGVGIALDAARQRVRHRQTEPEIRAVVRLLGTADMALSSASRWLRHPSLSEPGAAFADAPAILDADPAGAFIAPPRTVLAGSLKEPLVRLRGRGAP